jgi:integrase
VDREQRPQHDATGTRDGRNPAPRKRRGHGEGSVFKRKTDGRWCGQVDLEGRKVRRYFKTRKEATEWVAEASAAKRKGKLVVQATDPLADYLDRWFAEASEALRPPVAEDYGEHVERRIKPHLGRKRLDKITPADVQGWLDALRDVGVSIWTRYNCFAILRTALARAVELRLITENPTDAVKRPRRPVTRQKLWTPEQARAFFLEGRNDADWPLWQTIATTGMRLGEALALRWDAVLWQQSALRIESRVRDMKGGKRDYGAPKTQAGFRLVPVSEGLLATLKSHRAWVAAERLKRADRWKDRDLVFPSLKIPGQAQHRSPVLHRFQRLADRLGLPRTRLHNLRHLFATSLLVRNVHPKAVQEVLGHSRIGVTLDIYSQYVPGLGRQIVGEIEQAYGLDQQEPTA